jgi:hypothetical protein
MGDGANSFGTLINSGVIAGYITLTDEGGSLTNDGEIHGGISLGMGDVLLNTGTIRGDVILGAGDTLNTSIGEITGTVNAAAGSDTFDFSGSFKDITIVGFVCHATISRPTFHDVLEFASNDFANLAALDAHMTQEGKDTVITLDADTIVLQGIEMAHLGKADFVFG